MDYSLTQFVEPRLLARMEEQKNKDGIDLEGVAIGTKIVVDTRNSRYVIVKITDDVYTLQGGSRWAEPTRIFIGGSTFGGSCIRPKWLGDGMNIEIYEEATKKCVVTSPVKNLWIETDEPKET